MTEPAKAVFLSYASQDVEAARLICDALRAAGIEAWLERAYQQRDGGLADLKGDPLFETLHSDPRFKTPLRKMNLPN